MPLTFRNPATLGLDADVVEDAWISLVEAAEREEFGGAVALVGALMVTALALILDAALAFAVWLSVPGSGRLGGRRRIPQPLLGDEVALESRPAGSSGLDYEGRASSHTVDG